MRSLQPEEMPSLYAGFAAPITDLDCGKKCAPYNENGAPFCCDTRHAVPTAYQAEWAYLQAYTDLWHPWQANTFGETRRLQRQTPPGQMLLECLGHEHCQRDFRAIICRAFPFFPYIDRGGRFIGLSYYWEYEDRCWMISHLESVSPAYRELFMQTYERLFELNPNEYESYRYHSAMMRRVFGRQKRAIPLLHRNGKTYKITPRDGRLRKVEVHQLPKYGPYQIAASLPFTDEVNL